MSDYECCVCEYCTHDEKEPMWCPSCGSIASFKLMETDAQKLAKSEVELTTLRQLVIDLKADDEFWIELAVSLQRRNARVKIKESCWYDKHAALMERVRGMGIE